MPRRRSSPLEPTDSKIYEVEVLEANGCQTANVRHGLKGRWRWVGTVVSRSNTSAVRGAHRIVQDDADDIEEDYVTTPVRREPHWSDAFTFVVDDSAGPACAVARRVDSGQWVATVTAASAAAALRGVREAARPDEDAGEP